MAYEFLWSPLIRIMKDIGFCDGGNLNSCPWLK